MNVGSFMKRGLRSVRHGWNKHGQIITVIVAGASAVMAVYECYKATKKVTEIDEAKEEQLELIDEKLKAEEISQKEYETERKNIQKNAIKDYAICYGKTAGFLALSLGANAFGYKISLGKQAALLGMYKLSESKKEEIIAKTKEILGDKEYEKLVSKVESGIAADHIKATPMPEEVRRKELTDEEIQNAGDVTTFDYPCWDEWAGRYFSSTRAKIERAILAASARAGKEMFVPMNYIYDELNMACSAGGAENGFNSGDLENGLIPVKFYTIDDETYGPVLVMSLKPQQEERW